MHYSIKKRPKRCEDTGTLVGKVGNKVLLRVKMLSRRRWKYLEFNENEVKIT